MFEILFVIGFFIMLMVTGISLLGIFASFAGCGGFYDGRRIVRHDD